MTLGSALERNAAKYPLKKAVQDHRASLSYGQFDRRVNRFANALAGIGLAKGSRLLTLGSNCLELMELFYACLKLGVVVCPLDTRSTLPDQVRLVELVQPCGMAFHPDQVARAQELAPHLAFGEPWICLGPESAASAEASESLLKRSAETQPHVSLSGEEVAFVLFTGGTTGTPKGVELTHHNLIWNACNVITENRSPSPEAVICYPMQIYHSGALSRFLATIFAGGTFVGLPKFDAALYLDTLEAEGGTFVVGNQAIWNMLLTENQLRPRNLSAVSSWLHAQGDLSRDLLERMERELFPGAGMYASYALTEASPGVTVLKPWDMPVEEPSIGRPYMTQEVRLVDEKDQLVAPGEVGQILVRGPNVMRGYFRDPEATTSALAGGWLHTGDLGRSDELGYLYFVGRLKDMIKSGGLNVYAAEVEQVLCSHPEVAEAAVIGVPHPKWGESVCAVVVPRPGSQPGPGEIIDFCQERLASYKKPTSVFFAENLPKDSFGSKIKKNVLRQLYGGGAHPDPPV
ncbi:MAG: AMP-binding protein [Proteobacteria bacterium]|nr:AMP-binding protein [Pseudomonadota bacterium]MBU4573106.1 AMP-binding protein [Pseudomonadota bacterium]MBU4597085.1 AMP-binding protein [Pseudomonadota bacterium]MBV1715327.1 AMP-binding protein [Desulfarculus sp.]